VIRNCCWKDGAVTPTVPAAGLTDRVLPLIRTRADLHRWSAANAHGRQMHEALGILREAAEVGDPGAVLPVVQKSIASAVTVILRADDSSGIIGDAVRGLLTLHAELARRAPPSPAKLVAWMIDFQFDGKQDFFDIDPAGYAPALGAKGLALYRARLAEMAERVGPEPNEEQERAQWQRRLADPEAWQASAGDRHTRFVLEQNARRLAVVDRDVEAIIATHARDRKVAAWLEDTAEALAEIGEYDLAIDWARQATDFDRGHQSLAAARYWCRLLAEHRPDEVLAARLAVFRRWPSSNSAGQLLGAAGTGWDEYRDEVMTTLAAQPREAVEFALGPLADVSLAWSLAHSLALRAADVWERLVTAYETVDPVAVLPVLTELIEADLQVADAQRYRTAAKRLARMRRLAAGTTKAAEVDELVAELREIHRRRPRLQQEFDRARLP
jgi:tetratricopeptide (TPR) repeat protein